MKLEFREYRPFNLDGSPYEFTRPDKRIAYDARTFDWTTKQVRLSEPEMASMLHQIFADIAIDAEAKADCDRRSMACRVTDRNFNLLSSGSNAKPDGLKGSCKVVGCIPSLTCRLTLHAEQLTLNQVPIECDTRGLRLFNSAVPCLDCLKLCVARKVTTIYYKEERAQPEYDRPILSALTMFSDITFIKVSE
jgi:deoxycytidylate deaminase